MSEHTVQIGPEMTDAPVPTLAANPAAAEATSALSAAALEPLAAPAFQQYLRSCSASGVRDLEGLPLEQVQAYLHLNQYQRDQLSRTVPLEPFRLYRSACEMMEKDICPTCWLTNSCCMCSSLRGFSCRHKVFVFMHHKEFARGSNTGKMAVRANQQQVQQQRAEQQEQEEAAAPDALLSTAPSPSAPLTAASALIQVDIPSQAQALLELCEREPLNTVVLFPSKEAITIEEFVEKRGWRLPEKEEKGKQEDNDISSTPATEGDSSSASSSAPSSSSSSLPVCPPLNLILLDGTWRQARHMRFLLPPHIPAIRIDPFRYKLDGTLRPPEVAKRAEEQARAEEESIRAQEQKQGEDAAAAAAAKSSKSGSGHSIHARGKQTPTDPNAPTFVSLFYPLRKQSQPDRISTLEALVILLKDLQEPDTVAHYLLDLLRILVDTMRVQTGMSGVYGTYTLEQCRQMRIDVAMARLKKAKANNTATPSPLPSPSSDSAASPSPSDSSSSPASSSPPSLLVNPKGRVLLHPTADPSSYLFVSRKQRNQRAAALRPCLHWNHGEGRPCSQQPCRFTHICMLCNGEHRAIECSMNKNKQEARGAEPPAPTADETAAENEDVAEATPAASTTSAEA